MILRSVAAKTATCSRAPLQARCYSKAVRARDRVVVPCRSNGEITVDVSHPLTGPSHQDRNPSILIYLPRGPLYQSDEQETSTISQLSLSLPAHHIIRINYRLSQQHQYPTPIHDTLTAFDWIRENVLSKRAISRPGRADHLGRIAVCGELLGGKLASMLALTECRAGEAGIGAAAVNNPVVDWISLAGTARNSTSVGDCEQSIVERLLVLRNHLFSKPDKYFDPFASPILLFRTAGADVPPADADLLLSDMEQLSLHEREEYTKQHASTVPPAIMADNEIDPLAMPLSPPRKSSRRYPSASLNLRLPEFHISSGTASPFSEQANELARALRQSFVRQARQGATGSSFGRKVLLDEEEDQHENETEKRARLQQKAEAEAKAILVRTEGMGLWDGTPQGRDRVANVARWVAEKTV